MSDRLLDGVTVRFCRNRKCGDLSYTRLFCPTCRYLGRRAFALGAFVAGLISVALRYL